MTILSVFLTLVFLLVCVLMVMIVLLQPSQGEGLGSAFGGGISESFFGTRAMTWLARATIVLVLIYLGLAIGLNKIPHHGSTDGSAMPPSEMPDLPPVSETAETTPPSTESKPTESKPAEGKTE